MKYVVPTSNYLLYLLGTFIYFGAYAYSSRVVVVDK